MRAWLTGGQKTKIIAGTGGISCDVGEFIEVPGNGDRVLHFGSPASPVDYPKLPIDT
jgi:hypothetical protein